MWLSCFTLLCLLELILHTSSFILHMVTPDSPPQPWRFSPAIPVAVAVSVVLGLIGGAAFVWGTPQRAWNAFFATFFWMLISVAGTSLVRCMRERVRRGEWRRGLRISCEMGFPLTTAYLATVALVSAAAGPAMVPLADGSTVPSRPDMLVVAPVCFAFTMVVILLTGPLYAFTSPFRRATGDRRPKTGASS
jgi:hypothetical protein